MTRSWLLVGVLALGCIDDPKSNRLDRTLGTAGGSNRLDRVPVSGAGQSNELDEQAGEGGEAGSTDDNEPLGGSGGVHTEHTPEAGSGGTKIIGTLGGSGGTGGAHTVESLGGSAGLTTNEPPGGSGGSAGAPQGGSGGSACSVAPYLTKVPRDISPSSNGEWTKTMHAGHGAQVSRIGSVFRCVVDDCTGSDPLSSPDVSGSYATTNPAWVWMHGGVAACDQPGWSSCAEYLSADWVTGPCAGSPTKECIYICIGGEACRSMPPTTDSSNNKAWVLDWTGASSTTARDRRLNFLAWSFVRTHDVDT